MKKIKEIKKLLKNVYAWKINVGDIYRYNIYITKDFKKESVLSSSRQNIDVTLYENFGKEIGESSFSVSFDDNVQDIKKKIKDCLYLCNLSRKPKYDLAGKEKLGKVNLVGFEKPDKKLHSLYENVKKEFRKYKNIRLNSLEMHTSTATSAVINSNDVSISQKSTHFMVEMTITAKKGSTEQEFVAVKHLSNLNLNVKEFVRSNVSIVKDILESRLLKTFEGKVMLSGYAVSEFFSPMLGLNPLVMHASAKLKYMKLSRYNLKTNITKGFKGEKLTISLNPLLPLSPSSSAFDDDGIASKQVDLIKEGKFINYFASKQYADYLNIKATGAMGNIVIGKGRKTLDELRRSALKHGKYIEIVAFSSFSPNSISGDFSAEIRLGYLYDGNKKIAFKGGMFTGNVFELVKDVDFSKAIKTEAGYQGPVAVVFNEAVVAGME